MIEQAGYNAQVRGIPNVSGTSCHLGSALLILCHCFDPIWSVVGNLLSRDQWKIKDCNEESSNTSKDLQFLRDLFSFVTEQLNDNQLLVEKDHQMREIQLFFGKVYSHTGLNANNVGDAATVLTTMVHFLSNMLNKIPVDETNMNSSKIVDHILYSGIVQPILESTIFKNSISSSDELNTNCSEIASCDVYQRKTLKDRPMSNPVLLEIPNETESDCPLFGICISLESLLFNVFTKKEFISGYTWAGDYEIVNDFAASPPLGSCQTIRQLHAKQFPPILQLHLNRFKHLRRKGGNPVNVLKASSIKVQIPELLDSNMFLSPKVQNTIVSSYEICGGIVHVDCNTDKLDEDMEDCGHYISVIRKKLDGKFQWFKVNDDVVNKIDLQTALNLFSGMVHNATNMSDDISGVKQKEKIYRGVLIVYERGNFRETDTYLQQALIPKFSNDDSPDIQAALNSKQRGVVTDPSTLIGKRLMVQWANNKYFSGIVESYDAESGKHAIKYDDGDVKFYRLHKKTIKWET